MTDELRDTLARTIADLLAENRFQWAGNSETGAYITQRTCAERVTTALLAAFEIRERDQTPPADPPHPLGEDDQLHLVGRLILALRRTGELTDADWLSGDVLPLAAGLARLEGRAVRVLPEPTNPPELSWSEKETIADEVNAARKGQFERSFEIECPECGMPPGACCMNLGSAGGPVNHTSRIEAAESASGELVPPPETREVTK